MIQAIRIEFPNLSNAIRQKIRLDLWPSPSTLKCACPLAFLFSYTKGIFFLQKKNILLRSSSGRRGTFSKQRLRFKILKVGSVELSSLLFSKCTHQYHDTCTTHPRTHAHTHTCPESRCFSVSHL